MYTPHFIHFPFFSLFSINLRIQSGCRKLDMALLDSLRNHLDFWKSGAAILGFFLFYALHQEIHDVIIWISDFFYNFVSSLKPNIP